MSTDIAWQPQHRDSGGEMGDAHPQSTQQPPQSVPHVQEWDPSAFLNPSMFSSDLLSGSPVTTTPPNTQNQTHFQQDQQQHLQHQQQHNVPQLIHPLTQQPPFPQESFQENYMHDPYGQPYDMYHQSDMSRHSFESGRYRPSPVQQATDLSPSMAQLGLHQDFLYSAPVSFQHQQASQQNPQHAPLPQNLQGHPFDFRQSPTITPNDRASPHPRASPFTISPVSNHSFAQLQDFSGGPDRRPSTADSVHSLHGEYPSAKDFSMGSAALNGNELGRSLNGIPGVVPSAMHQFNQRNGTVNTASYHPHLSQDPSSMVAMNYGPVLSQPSSSASASASAPPAFISQTQPYPNHQASQYAPEQNFHIAPHALDSDGPVAYSSLNGNSPEIANYLRPILHRYLETRNRIGFGERTVIVMASKVAQKSYGQERRFLCPPPTAIMIGNSWWTESAIGRDDRRAPRVTVSISGESMPPESSVEWTSTSGRPVEPGEVPPAAGSFLQDDISAFENGVSAKSQQQQTYIGRAVGKQLFISDDKQKKVEALVKIVAQGGEDEPERIIGIFPSKPIKVISKPSKKRQSAKNMELCINHGSTVSLFHRLRAQTVSTKYLCVSGSGYSFKGSDGAPLPGVEAAHRANTPSFVAKIGTWDPFVIYIVDVTKPQGPDVVPPPPAQPDYPAPPPNAIAITHHGSHIPIYYNQTVVLQCLTSGVVSPVLIIRKVERDTTVVGGGLQEGAKGVPDHFCALGEVCGDPVSQLHKVAFEVYDPNKAGPAPGSPGVTGAFLACMADKVNTYRPSDGRTWNYSEMSSRSQSPAVPDSPGASSNGSVTDYFSNGSPVDNSSLDGHIATLAPSADGGRVNSRRGTKRSNTTTSNPVMKTTSKARRRVNSVGSNGSASGYASSSTRYGIADQSMASGALWSIDIGESAVWTIVGTEQIRYNFLVPPAIPGARASGVPIKPVTPFPNIVKYLPPDRAAENPMKHGGVNRMLVNHGMKADPRNSSLVTIYGENFSKTDPPLLFFGTEPSPFVDVRCQEVLACLPPQALSPGGGIDAQVKMEGGPSAPPQPIFIARSDGVIYPSNVLFYGK